MTLENFKLEYYHTEWKVENFCSHMINTKEKERVKNNKMEKNKSQVTSAVQKAKKTENLPFSYVTVEFYPRNL